MLALFAPVRFGPPIDEIEARQVPEFVPNIQDEYPCRGQIWIEAYDTISRTSMLEGLREVPEANSCRPFVRQFYAQPSTYVWHDTNGQPDAITQAEGGEQGDPLMPALFSLAQKGALEAVQTNLEEGEVLYAFLDDVYAVSSPHRVRAIYDLLAQHLEAHTSIRLNSGKTRIWNTAGHQPANYG